VAVQLEVAMDTKSEHAWLMMLMELARMNIALRAAKIHGPGTTRVQG
jgi:hypothetical protein